MNHVRGRVPEALLQSLLSLHSIEQVLKLLTQHFIAEVDETVRAGMRQVNHLVVRRSEWIASDFTIPVPILDEEKKLTEVFIFTLLCGAWKGFMKALKCENKNLS